MRRESLRASGWTEKLTSDSARAVADRPAGAGDTDRCAGNGIDIGATKFDDGYAFASCRDGTLAVAKETSPGKFEIAQTVKTKPGARTMGVDPMTHTVYLPTAEFQPQSGRSTEKLPYGS